MSFVTGQFADSMVPMPERSCYAQGYLSDHGQPQVVHQTNLEQENNLLISHMTFLDLCKVTFETGQVVDSMVPQAERS